MISIATPHIAEDWWKMLGNDELIASRKMSLPGELSSEEHNALEAESYLRNFLEQARKVAKVATKHIGGEPKSAIIHVSRPWKRELAKAAISHIAEGENVKTFAGKLANLSFVNSENRGEIMGFWGKRMLPQIFKWSDDEKLMISGELNEERILVNASNFICEELGLISIEVEAGITDIGRSSTATPLAPSIVYS